MLMKKLSATILTALTVFAMADDIAATEPTGRRIEQPFCEETISTHTILRAIELTDTATVIDYSFVYRPDYWCLLGNMELVGNNTGKVYRLKSVDGYELGKRTQYIAAEQQTTA